MNEELIDRPWILLSVAKPVDYGSIPLHTQKWDDAGVENAGLSKAAAPIKNQQWLTTQPQTEFADFGVPAKEIIPRFIAETFKAHPGVLDVGKARLGGGTHRLV